MIQFRKGILAGLSILLSAVIGYSTYNLPKLLGSYRIALISINTSNLHGELAAHWHELIDLFASMLGSYPWMQIAWFCFYGISGIFAIYLFRKIMRNGRGHFLKRELVFFLFWLVQIPILIAATLFAGFIQTRYLLPHYLCPAGVGLAFYRWPLFLGYLDSPETSTFLHQALS